MENAEMYRYLEQCRPLALTARAMIALLVVEKFCAEQRLRNPRIDEFLDDMWQWPRSHAQNNFDQWEREKPALVCYGLGDATPPGLDADLEASEIDEPRVRRILEGTVSILWGSFWGATENESSLRHLETVVTLTKVDPLPPITPFRFLKFAEDGWGAPSTQDCDYWETLRGYAWNDATPQIARLRRTRLLQQSEL